MIKKTEYDVQAEKFLADTKTTLTVYYTGTRPHFSSEDEPRDVYSVTLARGKKSYKFDFGDSIANTKAYKYGEKFRRNPSAYSILACLSAYEPADNIDDFATEYGYTKISDAIRVFNAVKNEYVGLSNLYSAEELQSLQDIN